jgi:hypothetical protein
MTNFDVGGGETILKRKFVSLFVATLLMSIILTLGIPVFAKQDRGYLYYEGRMVRTFDPNGKLPSGKATDPLYDIPGQTNVIQYAPGDKEYRGGHWAVYAVNWNVDPYEEPITSYEELLRAKEVGDVSIAEYPTDGPLCPVQPRSMWNPNA